MSMDRIAVVLSYDTTNNGNDHDNISANVGRSSPTSDNDINNNNDNGMSIATEGNDVGVSLGEHLTTTTTRSSSSTDIGLTPSHDVHLSSTIHHRHHHTRISSTPTPTTLLPSPPLLKDDHHRVSFAKPLEIIAASRVTKAPSSTTATQTITTIGSHHNSNNDAEMDGYMLSKSMIVTTAPNAHVGPTPPVFVEATGLSPAIVALANEAGVEVVASSATSMSEGPTIAASMQPSVSSLTRSQSLMIVFTYFAMQTG
jgi:hypothetical protein